jgi:hypothetical protein
MIYMGMVLVVLLIPVAFWLGYNKRNAEIVHQNWINDRISNK